jgi:hypothetical protein
MWGYDTAPLVIHRPAFLCGDLILHRLSYIALRCYVGIWYCIACHTSPCVVMWGCDTASLVTHRRALFCEDVMLHRLSYIALRCYVGIWYCIACHTSPCVVMWGCDTASLVTHRRALFCEDVMLHRLSYIALRYSSWPIGQGFGKSLRPHVPLSYFRNGWTSCYDWIHEEDLVHRLMHPLPLQHMDILWSTNSASIAVLFGLSWVVKWTPQLAKNSRHHFL